MHDAMSACQASGLGTCVPMLLTTTVTMFRAAGAAPLGSALLLRSSSSRKAVLSGEGSDAPADAQVTTSCEKHTSVESCILVAAHLSRWSRRHKKVILVRAKCKYAGLAAL